MAPTPPTMGALQGLTLFDGWKNPQALAPPVNTSGWEDCSYISAAGERLYFGYTQFDYYALQRGSFVIDGPTRPGEIRAGFEIFEATIADGGWNVVPSTANSKDAAISEAAEGVNDVENLMAFVRYTGGANAGDLYLTTKSGGVWGTATPLPAPINTPCIEDNAAVSRDGTKLYFDSNRQDPLGSTCGGSSPSGRTIYVSTLSGGVWGDPVALAGAPNQGLFHWQVYPRNDPTMYWAGYDTDCMADGCIYKAQLDADGGYANPSVVMQPTPSASASVGDVVAVGEVSMTDDGHWLYFTYIVDTTSADGGPDQNLNIGVANRP